MKQKTFCHLLLLVGIFLIFSCNNDDSETKSGIYLKKVIYHQNVDQIRFYNYNNQGLLTSREYKFFDRIVERFDYSYDKGLIREIAVSTLKNNSDVTLTRSQQLVFDYKEDKIVSAATIPQQVSTEYFYDSKGRVVKSVNSQSHWEYKYDQRGNMIEATSIKDDTEFAKFYCEYDQKQNPFLNMDPVNNSKDFIDLLPYYSPNNLVKETYIDERKDTVFVKEYLYQYNSSDLPTMAIELFTSKVNQYDRDTTEKRLFEYEVK